MTKVFIAGWCLWLPWTGVYRRALGKQRSFFNPLRKLLLGVGEEQKGIGVLTDLHSWPPREACIIIDLCTERKVEAEKSLRNLTRANRLVSR